MEMVSLSVFHAITVELHSGMLALTAFCITIIIINSIYKRTLGKRTKRFGKFLQKAAVYAEPTAYLAAIGGVIGLILSSISGYFITSGMYTSASEALVNSPITMNKIMFSMIALELWIIFVVVRSWYGPKLWKIKPLASMYIGMGLIAFTFTAIAGSMGGHITGKGSILDPLLESFGITYSSPWVMDMSTVFLLLIAINTIVVAFSVYMVYSSRLAHKEPIDTKKA